MSIKGLAAQTAALCQTVGPGNVENARNVCWECGRRAGSPLDVRGERGATRRHTRQPLWVADDGGMHRFRRRGALLCWRGLGWRVGDRLCVCRLVPAGHDPVPPVVAGAERGLFLPSALLDLAKRCLGQATYSTGLANRQAGEPGIGRSRAEAINLHYPLTLLTLASCSAMAFTKYSTQGVKSSSSVCQPDCAASRAS